MFQYSLFLAVSSILGFLTITICRKSLFGSDVLPKQRQMNTMKNPSIHLLQVPWWLPTTCAHPKSVSLPTATATTVATTRTNVTSSQSFSQRTPASVSHPSWMLFFYCFLFFISLICSSKVFSVISIFIYSAQLVSFLLILSFLFVSLLLLASTSSPIYPIAMLALLDKPVLLYHGAWMHVPVVLQIFHKKQLFHLVRLYNDFN